MKKILFGIFIGLFSISASFAAKVSGKVWDENGNLLLGATVCVLGTDVCAIVNRADDGFSFDVPNLKSDTKLVFEFLGYEDKTFLVSDLFNIEDIVITMTPSATMIDDVIVIKDVGVLSQNCYPDYCETEECIEPRYKKINCEKDGCKSKFDCVEQECKKGKYRGRWEKDGIIEGVDRKYFNVVQDENKQLKYIRLDPPEETIGVYSTYKCVLDCPDGFHQVNDSCRARTDDCTADFQGDTTNLATAKWDNGVCRVNTCKTGFEPNKKTNTCDAIKNCPDRLLKLYNAQSGEYKYENGKEFCVDIECKSDKYQFYGDPHNKCLQKCDVSNTDKRKGIASKAMADDGVCRVMECNTPQYVLIGTAGTADAKCLQKCDVSNADKRKGIASKAMADDGVCYPMGCVGPRYKLDGTAGTKGAMCKDQLNQDCKSVLQPNIQAKVKTAVYKINNNNKLVCEITGCNDKNYKPNTERNDCVQVKGDCQSGDRFAVSANLKNGQCRIDECRGELVPNDDKTACVCGKMPSGWSGQRLADDGVCYPTECVGSRWTLKVNGKKTRCEEEACKYENGTGQWQQQGKDGEWKCVLKSCDTKNGFVKNAGETACVSNKCPCGQRFDDVNKVCREKTQKEKKCSADNADTAFMECDANGNEYCVIKSCRPTYSHNKENNTCDDMDGTDCKSDANAPTDTRARQWRYKRKSKTELECKITSCDGAEYDTLDGISCVKVDGTCTDEQIESIDNAEEGILKDGECHITKCKSGFKPTQDKKHCEYRTDSCLDNFINDNPRLVASAMWENGVCVVKTCVAGHYVVGNKCKSMDNERCPDPLLEKYDAAKGTYKYDTVNQKDTCTDVVCKKQAYVFYEAYEKCLPSCVVTDDDRAKGIAAQELIDEKCYPTECVESRWTLKVNGKKTQCVETECKYENGTGQWQQQGKDGEWKCVLESCDTKNGFVKNSDNTACVSEKCSCGQKFDDDSKVCRDKTQEEKKCGGNLANVETAELRCDGDDEYCHVTECIDKNAFKIKDNKSCESVAGDKCTPTTTNEQIDNAKTYKKFVDFDAGTNKYTVRCGVATCQNDYEAQKDGRQCVQVKGACTPDNTEGVARATMRNGKCTIEKCDEPAYELNSTDNKCEPIEGKPCTDKKILKSIYASAGNRTVKNDRATCYPTICVSEQYELQNGDVPALATCWDLAKEEKVCTGTFVDSKGNNNVYLAKYGLRDGVFDCYVEQCKTGFKIVDNDCVTKKDDPCDDELLKKYTGAIRGKYLFENSQERCVDLVCDDENGYKPNSDNTACIEKLKECTSDQENAISNATEWGIKQGTEDCVALACECEYKLVGGKCMLKSDDDKVCTKESTPKLPEHAGTAHMECRNGVEVCVVDACESSRYKKANGDTECDDQVGKTCNPWSESEQLPDDSQISQAVYEYNAGKLDCVVKSCKSKDYDVIGNDCKQVRGACISTDKNALTVDGTPWGTYKKVNKKPVCVPDACKSGYKVKDGICTLSKCPCGYVEDGNDCKKRDADAKCYPESTPSAPAHANYGYYRCPDGENGAEICQMLKEKEDKNSKYCQDGYEPDYDRNRCLSIEGHDCMEKIKEQINALDDAKDVLNLKMVKYASWDVAKNGAIVCRVTDCVENYDPNADKNGCKRVSGPCTPDELVDAHKQAAAGEWKNGKCVVTECKDGWKASKTEGCVADPCGCLEEMGEDGKCKKITDTNKLNCDYNTVPSLHKYAAEGTMKCNSRGKAFCEVKTCKDGYTSNDEKTKCVSQKNDKCTAKDKDGKSKEHVKTARMREDNGKLACLVTECHDGYMVDKVNNICIQSDGECTPEQVQKLDKRALAGQLRKGECVVITKCDGGFEPDNKGKKCIEVGGPCAKMPERAKESHRWYNPDKQIEQCIIAQCEPEYAPSEDGTKCVSSPSLTREQAQKRIDDARAEYDAARENEQSLENRMLAATTMGTMGLGGKALAQSMAEQAADADAERDMAAYLASFRCDYGMGRNIKGGDKNVELPGGSVLIPMYSEYVALANDLKVRKEQLGLKVGIESEPILDSATTGLYDDVSTGITSGTYASLARAMLDPTGADAKMWAEQKEKTQQNLVAGAAAVGVGAVVGIAGNIAHTKAYKNKIEHLEALDDFKDNVDASPEQTPKSCPKEADGTYPECNCKTHGEYNSNTNTCDECEGDERTAKDGKCVNKPLMDGKADLVSGSLIGGRLLPDVSQLKVGQLKIRQTVELANGHLFNFESSELTDKTKSNLKQLAQDLKAKDKAKICEFDIFGYTDRSGSDSVNQTLSEKRAKAVKDYLEQQLKAQGIEYTVTATGMGEGYCFCEKGDLTGACSGLEEYDMPEDDTYYAPCRKVVIEAVCYRAQENSEN